MATRTARITLQTAVAPFVSTQLPRPVLAPDADNAGKVPRSFFGDTSGLDYNAVSVSFYENVMPVTEGWQSINTNSVFSAPSGIAPMLKFVDATEFYFSDPVGHRDATGVTYGRGLTRDSEIGYQLMAIDGEVETPGDKTVELYDRMPISVSDVWTKVTYRNIDNDTTNSTFTLKEGQAISWAKPNGVQFFCIPGSGVFFYGLAINATLSVNCTLQAIQQFDCGDDIGTTVDADLVPYQIVKNLPFNSEDIVAICNAQGYLVVASKNKVAYALLANSQFNFEEYKDGSVTGSGTRIPEDLNGEITALRAVPGGFIVFSEHNAVAAFYSSSNFAVPWNFRGISGAGGLRNVRSVSQDHVRGTVFATTSAGLQEITLNSAKSIDPAFDDYLSGKIFELYRYDTNQIQQLRVSSNIVTRCTLIGARYVVVSCGINFVSQFEIAYVYDMQLKRWGKIRKFHSDALQLSDVESARPLRVSDLLGYTIAERYVGVTVASLVTTPNVAISEYRQKIGLMLPTGEVQQVYVSQGDPSDDETEAVLRIAPIKVSRSKNITVHTALVDGVMDSPDSQLILQPSYDGRNWEEAPASDFWQKISQEGDNLRYGGYLTAHSVALTLRGKFNASTLEVEFSMEGTR